MMTAQKNINVSNKTLSKFRKDCLINISSLENSIIQIRRKELITKNDFVKLTSLRYRLRTIKFNLFLIDKHYKKILNYNDWLAMFNKSVLEKEERTFLLNIETAFSNFESRVKTFHKDFINKHEILQNTKNIYFIFDDNKKVVDVINKNGFLNMSYKNLKINFSVLKDYIKTLLIGKGLRDIVF